MRLIELSHDMLSNIIYFLEGDDFYRLIKTCKLLNCEFNELVVESLKNFKVNIFLQVDITNLFYRKYSFMLSRHCDRLSADIKEYITNYDGNKYGRKWSYIHINYDDNMRNVRIFKNHLFYTQICNNNHIKINGGTFITDDINVLLDKIPRQIPSRQINKNIYYILYNGNTRVDENLILNYIYNEWDFNGLYICNSIEEILESVSVFLKRGINKKYKWLEKNTFDTIEEYVNGLLRFANTKTLKFVNQLRFARIYCNRIYKISIINRWDRIYEYGKWFSNIGDDTKRIIECLPSGEKKHISSHPVLDIDGIDVEIRDVFTRITEYFF